VDRPCQVVQRSISKLKHMGHTRVRLSGLDIFTGRKYEAYYSNARRTNVIFPTVDCYDVEVRSRVCACVR
jgi:translation elongation factor P/translation initiation factor 5A